MKRAEKYWGSEYTWKSLSEKVHNAVHDYCTDIFNTESDVTKRELVNEAWDRLAEFYGFKVQWPIREPGPEPVENETKKEK